LDGKNSPVFEISFFSGRKVNFVGIFGSLKLKVLSREREEKQKKKQNEEKVLIFTQNKFLKKSILFFWCNLKTNNQIFVLAFSLNSEMFVTL